MDQDKKTIYHVILTTMTTIVTLNSDTFYTDQTGPHAILHRNLYSIKHTFYKKQHHFLPIKQKDKKITNKPKVHI